MTVKLRSFALVAIGLASITANRAYADSTPPTITAASKVAECAGQTTQVQISPDVRDSEDPLPTWQVQNRSGTCGTCSNRDPDDYPLGTHNIEVVASDRSGNESRTSGLVVVIEDTLTPTVQFGPTVPVVYAGGERTECTVSGNALRCECNAGDQVGGISVIDINRSHYTVVDLCDPNPQGVANFPENNEYNLGDNAITMHVADTAGNVAPQSMTVTIIDSLPPQITNPPRDFTVTSTATADSNCTPVRLPTPTATDGCSKTSELSYLWSYDGTTTADPSVCLTDGAHAIRVDVIDSPQSGGNRASTTFTVTVIPDSNLGLGVTLANQPIGYFNSPVSVMAMLAGNHPNAQWSSSPRLTGCNPENCVGSNVTMTFTEEASYCPLYVSATDGSEAGADASICFAIDQYIPKHDFTGLGDEIFYAGASVPLGFFATDTRGQVQSGVARVQVTVEEINEAGEVGTSWPVLDHISECSSSGLASCPTTVRIDGCDEERLGCRDNRLDLTVFGQGNFRLMISVTDAAGNNSATDLSQTFSVGHLPIALAKVIDLIDELLATGSQPVNSEDALKEARDFAEDGIALYPYSVGHGLQMAKIAWASLERGRALGAATNTAQDHLVTAIVSEVQRVILAHEARYGGCAPVFECGSIADAMTCELNTECTWDDQRDLCNQNEYHCNDWAILRNPEDAESPVAERYRQRSFLVGAPDSKGDRPKDYIVDVKDTLALSRRTLDAANDTDNSERRLELAMDAIDSVAMLFQDGIYAGLVGRETQTVYAHCDGSNPDECPDIRDNTAIESYFRGNAPSSFGDLTAQTVSNQIRKFTQDAEGGAFKSISQDQLALMNEVRDQIRHFSVNVERIKSVDPTFDNEAMIKDVYLAANNALNKLSELPQDRIYTHYWRAALSLTIAYVVNYSLYEGPTALYWLWGPRIANSKFLRNNGSFPINNGVGDRSLIDEKMQTAECRYGRLMQAVADGRVQDASGRHNVELAIRSAITLFRKSTCLIVDIYNQNFGGGQVTASDAIIPLHTVEYFNDELNAVVKCTEDTNDNAAWPTPSIDDECLCFGENIDVTGPDLTCDGRDDNCNGFIDEDYPITDCGNGPCARSSACVNGHEVECSPAVALVQADFTCDGIDNDCDGRVDPGMENLYHDDLRPVSCGIGACTNTSTCEAQLDDGGDTVWAETECRPLLPVQGEYQTDPTTGEWIEIRCDGRDNDCDASTDEGLDNDRDGSGCTPGSENCVREEGGPQILCTGQAFGDEGTLLWTGTDDGLNWDCNDNDPTIRPGLPEVCDYKDNDCDCTTDTNNDGQLVCQTCPPGEICTEADSGVDEGVLNACDHCEPTCLSTQFGGTGGIPFSPNDDNSVAITTNGDNELVITSEEINVEFAWVAISSSGRVAKIDTKTGREVGRYCVALGPDANRVPDTVEEPSYGRVRGVSNICGACGACNSGSRTAVDKDGNVFIANRAFGRQGSMTKIANIERNCVDLNQNGIIDTAHDWNNNGVIDERVSGSDRQEYFGENDECILWTKKPVEVVDNYNPSDSWPSSVDPSWYSQWLGQGYFLPRALAIDADGDVWLGNFMDGGFFEIEPESGKVKRFVFLGLRPYGATIDGRGILWTPHSCCGSGVIRSFNTTNQRVPADPDEWTASASRWEPNDAGEFRAQTWGNRGNYGIAIDNKNRVWLGSYGQNSYAASRYDPQTNQWAKVYHRGGTSAGMGRGVTVDPAGRAWVAQHGSWQYGRITGYDTDTLEILTDERGELLDKFLGSRGKWPIGIGIGSGGKIWSSNQGSQNLTALDPVTGAIGFYPEDSASGSSLRGAPYTYSDFTGNLRQSFTDPEGSYTIERLACPDGYSVRQWDNLAWQTTARPENTAIRFRVRVANSPSEFDNTPWTPAEGFFEETPSTPGKVSLSHLNGGQHVQVQVTLVANADNQTPILHSLTINRTCGRDATN